MRYRDYLFRFGFSVSYSVELKKKKMILKNELSDVLSKFI